VDHIFDWARDVYRPAILTELGLLAGSTGDAPSALTDRDSDIFSTRGTTSLDPTTDTIQVDNNDQIERSMATFRALDSPMGYVRHAAYVESRFCALFITRDNVETLLRSTKTNTVQTLCKKVLMQLADECVKINLTTVNEIERLWTGHSRLAQPLNLEHTMFYTVICFAAYFTAQWQPVRELNTVAVAEDAFEYLVDYSKLVRGRGKARAPIPISVERERLVQEVIQFRSLSQSATLMMMINRTQQRLRSDVESSSGIKLMPDDGAFRDIVQYVYKAFTRGSLEPTESFLRTSNRLEMIPTVPAGQSGRQYENLDDPNSDVVLVHGFGHFHDLQRSEQADVCIFFLRDPIIAPTTRALARAIKYNFETRDVYHTTRDNGTPNPKSTTNKVPWNLKNTYGVFTIGPEFSEWIYALRARLPVRQGSPRELVTSGRYLLQRNLFPWMDHRRHARRSDSSLFMAYHLMTMEIRYWRDVARQRRDRGILCCRCCGATDLLSEVEDMGGFNAIVLCQVCFVCRREIRMPAYPRWVADALAGDHSIKWRPRPRYNPDDDDLNIPSTYPRRYWRISPDEELHYYESCYKRISKFSGLGRRWTTMRALNWLAQDYEDYREGRESNDSDESDESDEVEQDMYSGESEMSS
jgi:hypothetical protein